MTVRSVLVMALWVAGGASEVQAQTGYPMLMSLKPVAAQVGQTSTLTVSSRYSMRGAFEVLVAGEGVHGEIVAEPEEEDSKSKNTGEKLQLRFTVAPDALPGVRDFRLATPQGASTLGQLVVVRDPVIQEAGPNEEPGQAQQVSLPATLCGAIEKNEDVDYFRFHVDAATSLTFHVRSQRLQDKIHDLQAHVDPIITLRSVSGAILAAADNEFFGDPLLSYRFEQGGDYLLEIRDVRYQGNPYWEYSVEVTSQPFVRNVFPLGLARGQAAQLELIGKQLPQGAEVPFTAPADAPAGFQWFALPLGDVLTNPVPLMVAEESVILEQSAPHGDAETAQAITIPAGVSGRIEREADVDCYAFEAKKGEKFSFELWARRQQSALDSYLRILDAAGKQLALNDDYQLGSSLSSDSKLEDWTAPADGRYVVEIRDLHLRGGPAYVYYLRAERSRPYFELLVDTDKTQLTPGTGGVIFVRAVRRNGFQGEIQLHIEGLPPSVTAWPGRILPEKSQDGCVVLHADYDAPLEVGNVVIRGTAVHETGDGQSLPLAAIARCEQEIYQPGGGRGHWPAPWHTVQVGAPSDIRGVRLSRYEVVLKPGESQALDVSLIRADGFDKNVTLDVTYNHLNSVFGNSLPPGVTLDTKSSKTLLTGQTSEGVIMLKAAEDAPPVEGQQVVVMANVSLNFVMKTTYASLPVLVSVQRP